MICLQTKYSRHNFGSFYAQPIASDALDFGNGIQCGSALIVHAPTPNNNHSWFEQSPCFLVINIIIIFIIK